MFLQQCYELRTLIANEETETPRDEAICIRLQSKQVVE